MKKLKVILWFLALICAIYIGCDKLLARENRIQIDDEYIGAYIDGEYTEDFPTPEMVFFDHAECDNGATATWDNEIWGLFTTDMTKRTKCNVYFKKLRLLEEEVLASLDTTGACPTVNEYGFVEMPEDTELEGGYVCSAPDRFGTSYYYRGDIKNNNVYFADMYWQIVRINGDGSIRIIYNGTTPNATGIDQMIDATTYPFNGENFNSPAYVGYMYGRDTDTREDNIENYYDSPIKETVDIWYINNIQYYSEYIADSGFCNDRSLVSGDGASLEEETYFSAGIRYNSYPKGFAIFTCPDEVNDLFTTFSDYGNGALSYPVGLITIDELLLSGIRNYKNCWSYSTYEHWTMSPYRFSQYYGYYPMASVFSSFGYERKVTESYGVRPVINLIPGIQITEGDGSAEKPFIVKTDNPF